MADSRNLPVLAGPERRRQLRELLAMPEGSWTAVQRQLYGDLVQWEFLDYYENATDIALEMEREGRQGLINFLHKGPGPPPVAQRVDTSLPSKGKALRDRNRRIREAREALDGRALAAVERVTECLVCGKPMPSASTRLGRFGRVVQRRRRSDAAYCSGACRQKALRLRKQRQP